MAASFAPRMDTFPGQDLPGTRAVKRSSGMSQDARLKRAARMLNMSISDVKKTFGDGSSKITESMLQQAERAAGTEYKTAPVAADAHFGGTGVKLARPLDGEDGPLDAESLLYAVKSFKRKLTQGIDSRKRLGKSEKTGKLAKSERPPQMVRSCETAGPGWTYCDPAVEGRCPDEEALVGTPYDNVWSAVGVPPNNKMVRCVPPELVRMGKTADQNKEKSMNHRLHRAVAVIAKEADNIHRLSNWRKKAPCGAIPEMAFSDNDAMCDKLHFEEDRSSPRCMGFMSAKSGLAVDDAVKTKAKAMQEGGARTCFANPHEYTRKMNQAVRAVELLRNRLRNAVEAAMQVDNFSERFNLLSAKLAHKYYAERSAPQGTSGKSSKRPFSWNLVRSYMLNADSLKKSLSEEPPDCEDTKKKYHEMQEIAALGGGGNIPILDDDCSGNSNTCADRLLRVLKLMHNISRQENELHKNFSQWEKVQSTLLKHLHDDMMCTQQAADSDWCENMQSHCNYSNCEKKDVERDCVKVGNERVSINSNGVTWQVDDFSESGSPIGFRWLVDKNIRRLYDDYTTNALYSCHTQSRLSKEEFDDLDDRYKHKLQRIKKVMDTNFTAASAEIFKASEKRALEQSEDQQAASQNKIEHLMSKMESMMKAIEQTRKTEEAVRNETDEVKKDKVREESSKKQRQHSAYDAVIREAISTPAGATMPTTITLSAPQPPATYTDDEREVWTQLFNDAIAQTNAKIASGSD